MAMYSQTMQEVIPIIFKHRFEQLLLGKYIETDALTEKPVLYFIFDGKPDARLHRLEATHEVEFIMDLCVHDLQRNSISSIVMRLKIEEYDLARIENSIDFVSKLTQRIDHTILNSIKIINNTKDLEVLYGTPVIEELAFGQRRVVFKTTKS